MCDGWHFNLELDDAASNTVNVDVHLLGTAAGNDLVVSSDSGGGTGFQLDAPYTANTWHKVGCARRRGYDDAYNCIVSTHTHTNRTAPALATDAHFVQLGRRRYNDYMENQWHCNWFDYAWPADGVACCGSSWHAQV